MNNNQNNLELNGESLIQFNIALSFALTMSKLCAQKCRLFRSDNTKQLSESETQQNCAAAINSNYTTFTQQLKENMSFAEGLNQEEE